MYERPQLGYEVSLYSVSFPKSISVWIVCPKWDVCGSTGTQSVHSARSSDIKTDHHISITFTVMLNFTGQQIRMWKIPGDRVSQRNSFLYSHWCIFAVRQCSLSIQSCVSLVGSSYTGLSWAALCPYLTLADIFSSVCWHKFLPTKQFKWACDKWYLGMSANILCSPVSCSFHGWN